MTSLSLVSTIGCRLTLLTLTIIICSCSVDGYTDPHAPAGPPGPVGPAIPATVDPHAPVGPGVSPATVDPHAPVGPGVTPATGHETGAAGPGGKLKATSAYSVNKKVTLECTPLHGHGSEIRWFRDGKEVFTKPPKFEVEAEHGKLVIEDPVEEDIGPYTCFDTGSNVTDIAFLLARPLVVMVKSVVVQKGTDYDLQCVAKGFPIVSVQWFANSQPLVIDKSNPRIDVVDSVAEDGEILPNGTLKFRNLDYGDYKNYSCTVGDGFGNFATDSTTIRVKNSYTALWPFLGIIGELVIIGGVIGWYEHRKNRVDAADRHETEEYKKTNSVEYKRTEELRQRQRHTS